MPRIKLATGLSNSPPNRLTPPLANLVPVFKTPLPRVKGDFNNHGIPSFNALAYSLRSNALLPLAKPDNGNLIADLTPHIAKLPACLAIHPIGFLRAPRADPNIW